MPTQWDRTSTDRRAFLKVLGLAGLSSTLGAPALALAQSSKSSAGKAAKKKAAKSSPPPDDKKEEISPDAKSLAAIVKRRYGDHLTKEQLEGVAAELNWRVRAGEALRKAQLTNSDEPDFTFFA